MSTSPGTNFDDARFRADARTPSQRMTDGDYYVADDELSAHTKRAVRLLSLYTAVHPTEPGPRRAKWESCEPITLEDNVWLGGSVTVCPGVTIGENSIIGAGAVVTRSIPANSIAVGNPARVIKALDPRAPRPIEAASVGVINEYAVPKRMTRKRT